MRAARNSTRAKRVVVKVQASIYTTEGRPQVLVYSQDRALLFTGSLPSQVQEVLGDRPKAFFYAWVDARGKIVLDAEAPWQAW